MVSEMNKDHYCMDSQVDVMEQLSLYTSLRLSFGIGVLW